MFEFFNAPIACAIISIIMILMVEISDTLHNQEVEEWEANYASENQE